MNSRVSVMKTKGECRLVVYVIINITAFSFCKISLLALISVTSGLHMRVQQKNFTNPTYNLQTGSLWDINSPWETFGMIYWHEQTVNVLERLLDTIAIIIIHTECYPEASHYSTLPIYQNANRFPEEHIKQQKIWKCMGHYSTANQHNSGAKLSYLPLIVTKFCRLFGVSLDSNTYGTLSSLVN